MIALGAGVRRLASLLRGRGAAIVASSCGIVVALCFATAAIADEPAAADTLLGRYLEVLADSTDAHFGVLATPTDTTGLDSARVFALDHPEQWNYRKRRQFSLYPVFDFNRVDGPVMGAGVKLGTAKDWGRWSGDWAWAAGPNLSLGSVSYEKTLRRGAGLWELNVQGGRYTPVMDREDESHGLSTFSAFISGGDRSHFLRQDGVTVKLSRGGPAHRIGVSYRDELESPMATTATWNLLKKEPDVIGNVPANLGRAREIGYEFLWRVPKSPVTAQLMHWTSSRSINSDFEYRRTRATLGADIALGRLVALVPQLDYGALSGEYVPQQAFTLGGSHTLRSISYATAGGSRLGLAKLEAIMVRNVFEIVGMPNLSPIPLQLSVFGATGAVWGPDPYTGEVRPGIDWPNAEAWRHEAGIALMFQPGIPDPAIFVRLNWAHPLGPSEDGGRISIGIGRGLDRLGKLGGE